MYYAVKYLPLVIVALITNLAPIATAILSYIVLKEKFQRLDYLILVVSFVGVIILIIGSIEQREE